MEVSFMRKASMVLGLIGGILAILIALLLFAGGAFISQMAPSLMESEFNSEYAELSSEYPELNGANADIDMDTAVNMVGYVFAGIGGLILVAGILGVVGAVVVKKSNVLAGVLMILGGILALISIYGFISFILLLLGGIFALVRDNSANQPAFSPDFD